MDLSQLVGKIEQMSGISTSLYSPSFDVSNYESICNKRKEFLSTHETEFWRTKMAKTDPPLYNTGWGKNKIAMNERNMLFTPLQWIELEHQALIYKYINAKAPIPSSLLLSICKNLLDTSSTHRFTPNNTMGWLKGGGGGGGDVEEGRCKRTDGKKWRCARSSLPDSKYCERHVVRNRHRSRKPVEPQQGQQGQQGRSLNKEKSSINLLNSKQLPKSPPTLLSYEPILSHNTFLNFSRSSYTKNNLSFSPAISPNCRELESPHLLQDFIGELTKIKPPENKKPQEFDFTQIGPLGEILGNSSSHWTF